MASVEFPQKTNFLEKAQLLLQTTWSRFRYGFLLLIFFGAVLVFMRWALPVVIQPRLSAFFKIENIDVAGKIEFASLQRITNVIQSHTLNKALYQVEADQLKIDLGLIPWVERIKVERVWPHQLKVSVEETVPIAIWNKDQILSHRGDLFKPQNIEVHNALPSLLGAETQVHLVTDMYRQASKILRQAHLKLYEVQYEKGFVWRLFVNDKNRQEINFEIVMDGEKSVSRLYRFIEHYPSLSQMEQSPKRVDLRYPTGMAVAWQGE